MKYFARPWAKEYEGVLFFVQRLEEMLFHYSTDIVRAPVHNTHTLIHEYISIREEVKENRTKQYQLDQIGNELKESLRVDRILLNHFGEQFVDDFLQYEYAKWDDMVIYLNNKIGISDYVDWCREYILNEIPHSSHKKEIEFGLRAWIASIVWFGYSAEHVYEYLHSLFEKDNDESPIEKLQGFLEYFDFEDHNFKVYLVFKKESLPYKALLEDRLGITFIEEKKYGELVVKENRQIIGFVEVDSLDNHRAMELAVNRINIFVRYYQVLSNRRKSFINRFGLVCDTETNEQWMRACTGTGIKAIETPKSIDVGSQIDFVIIGRKHKSESSNSKIEKMISLHNTAINQTDINDAFINLWSILEVIAVNDSNENKIEMIVDRAIPILQQEYSLQVFVDIVDALKDNLPPATFSTLISQIEEFDNELQKTMALIFLKKYETLLNDLFNKSLSSLPIIRNKIYRLYEMRDSTKQFANMIRRYGNRVKWHIYRLYRARNAIVHSGDTPKSLKILSEHLHIYVDVLMENILYKLSAEDTLYSILDVLTDTCFVIRRKMKLLDQEKSVDESMIKELSSFFFWQEGQKER